MATVSKTIASSGADYTDIAAWEASVTNATDTYIGTCTERAQLGGAANITFNATAGTGGNYRLLTADTDSRVQAATWKECTRVAHSVRRFNFTSATWEVDGLGYANQNIIWSADCQVRNMAIRRVQFQAFGAAECFAENCVVMTTGDYQLVYMTYSGATFTAYHCSFYFDQTYAPYTESGGATVTLTACVSYNAGTGNDMINGIGDWNVYTDTSGDGANDWQSESNPYVSATGTDGEQDLTLRHGARKTYGVSDYTSSAPNVGTDIYGTPRGSGYRDAGAVQEPDTPSNTLLDNIVAFWTADESSAAHDLDDDYGTKDLTRTSNPPLATDGMVSDCRHPDGSADYFSRTSDGSFDFDAGGYFAGWFWFDEGGYTGSVDLAGKDSATATNAGWRLGLDSSSMKFQLCDGTTRQGPTSSDDRLDDVRWLFIECEWAGSGDAKITIDRDTSQQATTTITITPQGGSDAFAVAASSAGTRLFDGKVNALGFWSSAPSTADRDALFNARHGLPYSDFTASSGGAPPDLLRSDLLHSQLRRGLAR